jgi:hypothetical protein
MTQTTPDRSFVNEAKCEMDYALKVFYLIPTPTNYDYAVRQLTKYQERWIAEKANARN